MKYNYLLIGDYLTKKALFYVNEIFKENKSIDFVFGTVKRYYTANTILKYGYNRKLKYNFDFATAHSTGFFFKKIFSKSECLILNINVQQIMICIIGQ